MSVFVHTRRIAFHETDAAGVMHFSRVLCLVEEAEHDAMHSMGIPILNEANGWPRVRIEADYRSPLKQGDMAEVKVSIQRVGASSVTWGFTIHCKGREIANGSMVTVLVDKEGLACGLNEWRAQLEAGLKSDGEKLI